MTTAVLILNWNGRQLLERFLPAVINYSGDADIMVVDNASEDDSVSWLSNHYPSIRIIRHTHNYGYAEGYNRALQNLDHDIFCLLNSDVEVTEGWLEPIVDLFSGNEKVGAAQPKIKDYKRKSHFEYAGAAGGFLDKLGYPYCRGRVLQHLEEDKGQYDDSLRIHWASGACLFVRSSFFWQVGGMDINYFAHQEEIDFCWRLRNAGFEVWYEGRSLVYHVGGATLSHMDPQKTFLNFRNSLYTLLKNLPRSRVLAVLLLRGILDGVALFYFLFRLQPIHSIAIFWSHISFYRHFRSILKYRDPGPKLHRYYLGRSIIWQHYLMGRKFWNQID